MDAAALAALKAELVRKKNEAQASKLHKPEPSKVKKIDPLWSKSKPSKEKIKSSIDTEEERRVHSALELKARLYDQMKDGKIEDKDGRFLIDFKSDRPVDNSDDEEIPELLSEDGRREMVRQKWEKIETENLVKPDIHYGDVLFDEARTHGAAFYNFSRDEATRLKELADLKKLHEETERERKEKLKSKKDRKSAMNERLKKVRDRKRLKMGLPLLNLDDEEVGPEMEADEPLEDVKEVDVEQEVENRLKAIREKEEEAKRRLKVRDWDVGKKSTPSILTAKPKEHKVLSQNEWIDARRSDRKQEFAPPTALYSKQSGDHKSLKTRDESPYNAVPPPTQSTTDTWQRPPPNVNTEQRTATDSFGTTNFHQRKAAFLGSRGNPVSTFETSSSWKQSQDSEFHKLSSASRLQLHKEMQETVTSFRPIVNELEMEEEPVVTSSEGKTGVEIPPPCDMNYYTATANKRANWQGLRTKAEMSDSFQFGLNQLSKRKQNFDSDDSE